jgi:hypothetical protein
MIPELKLRPLTHGFCIEFIKALGSQRSTILPGNESFPIIFAQQGTTTSGLAGDQSAIFDEILDKCLDLVIAPLRETVHLDDRTQVSRARVIHIVELCITTARLEVCREFLQHILSFPWAADTATQKMFAEFFIPVIKDLRSLLQQYTIPVPSPPFSYFFGVLIMRYTRFVLGRRPLLDVTPFRSIGCGCSECEQLVQFLTSSDSDELHVLADKTVLEHMEGRLRAVAERITIKTVTAIPGRHRLEIHKKPSIAQREWNSQKGDAIEFFLLIGDRSTIREIFGGKLDEAVELLLKSGTDENLRRVTIDVDNIGI